MADSVKDQTLKDELPTTPGTDAENTNMEDKNIPVVPREETETLVFSMELHTRVISEKGIELHVINVQNVMSFSCICVQCEKAFTTKSLLKSHMRSHSQAVKNLISGDLVRARVAPDSEVERGIRSGIKTENVSSDEEAQDHNSEMDSSDHGDTDANKNDIEETILPADEQEPVSEGEIARPCTAKEESSTPKEVVGAVEEEIGTLKVKFSMKKRDLGSCSVQTDKDSNRPGHVTIKLEKRQKAEKIASKKKSHECMDCGKVYMRKYHLDKHARKHTRAEDNRHACDVCSKQFKTYSDLKRHRSIHSGEKTLPCTVCGRMFRLRDQVTEHMKVHMVEKPHICSICGMSFSRGYYLKRHTRKQHGGVDGEKNEQSYLCPLCGKVFKHESTLYMHKRSEHDDALYTCEICGKAFTRPDSLRAHFKRHSDVKPHLCAECGKSFFHKNELTLHMISHTGRKPYPCTECGKQFSQKFYYEEHMRIHTGEMPLKCTHCNLQFRARAALRQHVKTEHHGTSSYSFVQNPRTSISDMSISSLADELANTTEDPNRTTEGQLCTDVSGNGQPQQQQLYTDVAESVQPKLTTLQTHQRVCKSSLTDGFANTTKDPNRTSEGQLCTDASGSGQPQQ